MRIFRLQYSLAFQASLVSLPPPIIKDMAGKVERPIIFPLSNPYDRAEAVPGDLIHWTDGRALIATGTEFPPVSLKGRTIKIAQCNNFYIFPVYRPCR